MKSNPQQERIFNASINRDIAVSAGAGTGKSTTLNNKVIDLLKKREVKPSEFLIVTFTKDAANSLKNKIKVAVRNEGLTDIISEVDSMHVDTLDAFRLFVVKKYANKLGIDGEIEIINDSIYKLERSKILDELLNNMYESDDKIFKEYIEEFAIKSDYDMRNLISYISSAIDTNKYSKEEVINSFYNEFYDTEEIRKKFNKYLELLYKDIPDLVNYILGVIEEVPEEVDKNGDVSINPLVKIFYDKLADLEGATSPKDIIKGLITLKNDPQKFTSKKQFEGYKECKEKYDYLKKVKIINESDLFNIDLKFNQEIMPLFIGIAYDLKSKLNEFMKTHGVYTFNDIANLALEVLKNEDVLKELKDTFKVVMIDEYQDNSDLDDEFFTKIANNNLFLVGDVKQSIYGFKGANPNKFLAKYNIISERNYEEFKEERYTMNINYRSRREILDGVNRIFENYMDFQFGGVDYKFDHHELVYDTNITYDSCEEPKDKDKGIKSLYALTDEELVEKYNLLTGENKEPKFAKDNKFILSCALNILDRLNNNAQVTDSDSSKLKNLDYKDIAILTRINSNSNVCREIFSNLGLPVNIITEENINGDEMVLTLLSLIKAVDIILNDKRVKVIYPDGEKEIFKNENKFKQYYASILRSFIYRAPDQEIYNQIANTSLLKNKENIQNLNYRNSEIYLKIEEFALRHKSSSLYDIVVDLFNEFNFFEKVSTLGNGISYLNKFSLLLEQIKGMDSIGYQLSDLMYFFENINKLNLSIEIRLGSDSPNAITIETIHKSKGLEFPLVYVECTKTFSAACNSLQTKNHKTSYFGNDKFGYYLPRKTSGGEDDSSGNTFFISNYAELMNMQNVISEETRLFYVALTRAKEVAICVFFDNEGKVTKDSNKIETRSYQDIVTLSQYELPIDQYGYADAKLFNVDNKENKLDKEEVHILDNPIIYNFINIINNKAHPSIELESDVSESLLKKGTRYHAYMQYVDLVSKDTSFISNEKERRDIDKVLTNEIFTNIKDAKVFREYSYYDEDIDENGVIDLLIVYENKCLVVDYKLKNADEEKYKTQLDAYKRYVEKVFELPVEAMLLPLMGN